jgi:hypothetical protein
MPSTSHVRLPTIVAIESESTHGHGADIANRKELSSFRRYLDAIPLD